MVGKPKEQIWEEWMELMNMAPAELDHWLGFEESRSVGDDRRRVDRAPVRMTDRRVGPQEGGGPVSYDRVPLRRVVGYIKRHVAQGGPAGGRPGTPVALFGHEPRTRPLQVTHKWPCRR